MRKKRGQVDIHINWIFILVAGGLILLFFASVAIKQRAVSEAKYNIAVSKDLSAILSSSQVAAGTANVINVPYVNIDFDCNNYYVGEIDEVGNIGQSLG